MQSYYLHLLVIAMAGIVKVSLLLIVAIHCGGAELFFHALFAWIALCGWKDMMQVGPCHSAIPCNTSGMMRIKRWRQVSSCWALPWSLFCWIFSTVRQKTIHVASTFFMSSEALCCLLGAFLNALCSLAAEAMLKKTLQEEQARLLAAQGQSASPSKLMLSNAYSMWTSFF
jgi:hypothetical protein